MRIIGLIRKYGVIGFLVKAEEKLRSDVNRTYSRDYCNTIPDKNILQNQTDRRFGYEPLISIVVPAYNTDKIMLKELMESVINQSYSKWQLCIADASNSDSVSDVVKEYSHDSRIVYKKLKKNGGISENTNEGFTMADGEYIALLDHDDCLSRDALYEMVNAMNSDCDNIPELLYSDEDKISQDSSMHYAPHFKSDINRELLNHYNYICHFLVFKRDLLEKAGNLNKEYDGSQDYDFILRMVEQLPDSKIAHVRKVLYHWRVHNGSTAGFSGNKNYAYDAGIRALKAYFNRCGLNDTVVSGVKGQDYVDADRTAYADVSRLVFNKADNINACSAEWQKQLAQYFVDDSVGIAGGKIVTGGKILSSGIAFNSDGEICHEFQGMKKYWKGYCTLAKVPREVSAVSLEFCAIRKDVYDKVGDINYNLPSPYRDMEYAARVKKAGYKIVIDGRVTGSIKRSHFDKTAWQKGTVAKQYIPGWDSYIAEGDPFYNEKTHICGYGCL